MHLEAAPKLERARLLDWVVERATAQPTARLVLPATPAHPLERLPSSTVQIDTRSSAVPPSFRSASPIEQSTLRLLDPLKTDWSNLSVLEVAESQPVIPSILHGIPLQRYTAVMSGRFDAATWASRFPRFSFLTGPLLECLGSVGRSFDRMVLRISPELPLEQCLELASGQLVRRGQLVLHSSEIVRGRRIAWQAALGRVRMRVIRRELLDDKTVLILSQRK